MDRSEISVGVMDAYILGTIDELRRQGLEGTVEQGFEAGIFNGSQLAELNGGLSPSMSTAIQGLKMTDPKFGLPLYAEPKPELGEANVIISQVFQKDWLIL